ncbi:HrpF/NolX family T3SS translocon protein [Variovorax sp. 770b2]|uniref:HrpF/NolX family T3SS translocon protein n=1 Tax=Variovorax sp. 770b2 TaxID=1566271 RepID=UPI0008F04F51|nr:HrpF/NolX family T3SS translocon protein [Variovorax sp. 770b2]SFQ03940.1 type III secretion translocon protein HrpF [Variovorax sp. 770b2]
MQTTVSRQPQSSLFGAPGTATAGARQPASPKGSALPSMLAAGVWSEALTMLKSALQGAGGNANASEGAPDKQPSSPALEHVANKQAEAGHEGAFDFAKFAELVQQLCNLVSGGDSSVNSDPVQSDSDPSIPQAGAEGEAADPAVEQKRMETVAILGRHEGKFKKAVDGKGLDKMLADKNTPPDLKRAIQNLKDDPEMMGALDEARTGKSDGKFSAKDINILQSNSSNRAFAEQKAEDFEQTYIPSDCKEPNAKPRPITNNDAQRELFRYSDHLPKNVSRESLQKIVDGTAEQGKCPPQLVAAAKFYVDNPDAWQKDMGKGADEGIRKDGLCAHVAKSVELTADEDKTLEVLDQNRDVFFDKGNLTDTKLKRIAEDPAAKPEVRDAARALQDKKGSLVFSMLDNGKHGFGGNLANAADDRSIGQGDLDRVLQGRNKTIATAEKTAAPDGAAGAKASGTTQAGPAAGKAQTQAAQDMSDGTYNQPDNKSKKGGQLRDVANFFLKAYSAITNVLSSVLAAVASLKIPGVSWLAAAGAVGAKTASGLAKVGSAALEQGDVKGAAVKAGIGVGTTAAGMLIPGGGKIVGEAGKFAANGSARTWSQHAVNASTSITNGQVAKEAGKAAAKSIATTTASTVYAESETVNSAVNSTVTTGANTARTAYAESNL